jgi:ABC-2 type transport system ATP-binding protein
MTTTAPTRTSSTTDAPVLTVSGLTKRYGDRLAVDHLDLRIPRGVVAGFIGPNGAGKTTTMAMLVGLARPTAGDGTILGVPIRDTARALRRVGALLEGPAMWPSLTARQNLVVLARLGGQDEDRIAPVLELVGLADRADDKFGKFSLGMKQRLGIAAALLGDPELLILDEPTNGLDPAGISDMRELLVRIAGDDRTVLVSSHLLNELEQICDWLVIIDGGRLLYSGPAREFGAATDPEVVLRPVERAALEGLSELVSARGLESRTADGALLVPVGGYDALALAGSLNGAAATGGIVLSEVRVQRPTLEAAYLDMLEGVHR